MEYFNLRVAIGSSKLRRILSHWLEIRGNRLMPMWQDICPAKIKSELSVVWQYRYDRAEDEFFGGLSGDAIQRLIGGPIKNARFRELHKGDPHFFARAKRVLFDPAIFCGRRTIKMRLSFPIKFLFSETPSQFPFRSTVSAVRLPTF